MREREREISCSHVTLLFFCSFLLSYSITGSKTLFKEEDGKIWEDRKREKYKKKKKSFPPSMFSIDNGKCIYIFFIWLEEKMK